MIWKMKVLVIDDEPNIREGLKTLIDWERLQCILVGEAENGEEGLEKILLLHPDLVIVDIKMPEIDGIELIERLTRKEIETEFIVLSGYQDFGYAKRAMECGVNHYILKPIDEDLLEHKVIDIYTVWKNKKMNELALKRQCQLSKEQMIKYIALGHEDVESYMTDMNYEELNRWYELDLPWKFYTILLLDGICGLDFKERHLIKKALAQLGDYRLSFESEGLIGILVKNKNYSNNYGSLFFLRERINKLIRKEVLIAVGITVDSLDEVGQSFAFAKYLIDRRFLYEDQNILHKQMTLKHNNAEQNTSYAENGEMKLYQAVCTNQQDEVNDLLEGMRGYMETSGWDSERIKAFYLNVYVGVMTSLVEHQHGLLEREFLNPKVFEEFYHQSNLFKLHGFIKFQFLTICEYIDEMKPQNTLGKVIDYIEHHYKEDLKIETLSKIFHYSSNYLGKQFKKETGKSFNSFLDDLRIKEAEKLLGNSKLKIYEIAQITGFHDPDYFAAKFKKHMGISPKEYRIFKS
ncbi:two-component system response regulator YesN [Mobilisporobacter senegalensis]|uniref:Stage 0 sporulation protein A homolog n=1 Tax=Mobilisporobacter senegalensis TaxID=1329262 RepID=A0A3N1XZL2_9FIRM|nr:response regulator [Mobilisporobacter senegalensis]ROR30387.1 two-component system response regulator YesN [Mobilisporobacter senegalensis]